MQRTSAGGCDAGEGGPEHRWGELCCGGKGGRGWLTGGSRWKLPSDGVGRLSEEGGRSAAERRMRDRGWVCEGSREGVICFPRRPGE